MINEMDEPVYHIPALLSQSISALDINPAGIYVDVTYGGGGHSRAILQQLTTGHLYAFDQDTDALERATPDPRLTLIHGNFRYLRNFLRYEGVMPGEVDGLLGDLGVSFHHFDDTDRGFSFRWPDAPLDMRMNRNAGSSARTLLETMTEDELADMLRLYGELPQARRMAARIVAARQGAPLVTAGDLISAVSPVINPRQEKKELAQVFQALRITVNDEMDSLRRMLTQALDMLGKGGRLAIITYHSLEDRIVKNFMKTGNFEGHAEKDFFGRSLAKMKLLTPPPMTPDAEESENNPRSRSAKLRVAEKI